MSLRSLLVKTLNPRVVRVLTSRRRALFELLGNPRYSRPALNGLDILLESYLPGRGGVFVEAGGNDGFTQSNTYYFERMKGWTGVLIEPVPALAEKCKTLRRASKVYCCALVPFGFEHQTVGLTYCNLMTITHGTRNSRQEDESYAKSGAKLQHLDTFEFQSPARTLSSVLDEAGVTQIDLLSLDVEGYEASALRGLDMNRHKPRFILVECLFPEGVHEVLKAHYDLVTHLSVHDRLYRRK